MFKKIPYGVKVRVKGSDETGYVPQIALACYRFLPFFDSWANLYMYTKLGKKNRFDTIEEAQQIAMKEYNQWIAYYKDKEADYKASKKVSKRVVWIHP